MLSPVSFDNQAAFRACEVGDAATDGFLPSKLESAELPIAEPRPQSAFGVGRLPTKSFRMRAYSSDRGHENGLEEEKPSPNPLPQTGEGYATCVIMNA